MNAKQTTVTVLRAMDKILIIVGFVMVKVSKVLFQIFI